MGADFLPVCCAASTSMTVLVLPSGPKVQTSFCTATLLVGGRRPLGDGQSPNCCWKKQVKVSPTRDIQVNDRTASIIMPYLWENIRSGHAPAPLTGHPVRWPQGQRSFTDVCWDGTDHSGLHGPCIGTREGLVEAHHRWAGSRHNLVVSVVIGDRRLRGGQDGVGQVRSARAGVRLLPAQLPAIIHRMLPKMHQKSDI